jgi:hypothetical protein
LDPCSSRFDCAADQRPGCAEIIKWPVFETFGPGSCRADRRPVDRGILLHVHDAERTGPSVGTGPVDRLAGLEANEARAHLRTDGKRAALDVGVGWQHDLDASPDPCAFVDERDDRTKSHDIPGEFVARMDLRSIDLLEQHFGDLRSCRFQAHRLAGDQSIIGSEIWIGGFALPE